MMIPSEIPDSSQMQRSLLHGSLSSGLFPDNKKQAA